MAIAVAVALGGTAVPAQQPGPVPVTEVPAGTQTGVWDVLSEPFPYEAKDVTMQSLAKELTQKTGIPVIGNRPSGGSFAVDNTGGSVRQLLDRLEADGRTLWWWDGGAIHFEAPDSITSTLIPLQGVSVDELIQQVSALGIDDVKYPIMSNPDARFVRVVGPQGYVDALRELIGNMGSANAPAMAGQMPVIIRGRSPLPPAQSGQGQTAPGQQVPQGQVVYGQPAQGTPPAQVLPVDPRQPNAPRTQ